MGMRVNTISGAALGLLGLVALASGCKSDAPATGMHGGAGDQGDQGGSVGSATGGTGGGSGGSGGNMSVQRDSGTQSVGGTSGGGAGGDGGGAGGMSGDPDASMDAPALADASHGDASYPDSDYLPGRPDIRLCKKEWTAEQCCAFLCGCLNTICADSAKAKAGVGNCMSWCPKLSSMAMRCHVYHCYVSISPTGGINDHDSHCGHAANQVQGGGCPTTVYQ
jgi:hypothetical protein